MAMFSNLSEKRWRVAGTIAAVAVTTTAGGVAWAATSADPTPSPSASPSTPAEPGKPGKGMGHGPGGPGQFFGQGGALHGEFVVKKDGGGYQTVATQRGEVTAVSKDSITLKSEDGYSRTYTLTADTLVNAAREGIGDVKTGNTVVITALVADGKATATTLRDGTVRKAAGEKWGFHRGPR